jgi:hypothetical protein
MGNELPFITIDIHFDIIFTGCQGGISRGNSDAPAKIFGMRRV